MGQNSSHTHHNDYILKKQQLTPWALYKEKNDYEEGTRNYRRVRNYKT